MALVVEGERVDAMLGWDEDGPSLDMIGDEAPGDGERDFTLVQTDDGMIALADGRQTAVRLFDPLSVSLDEADGGGVVKAPMHGKVVAVFVVEGEAVEKGQRIAIVEAMKMEHALVAPRAGAVMELPPKPASRCRRARGSWLSARRIGEGLGERDRHRLAARLALCWVNTCYIAAGHVKLRPHRDFGSSASRVTTTTGDIMATYISLVNWTDQGIKSVKESPVRLDAAKALARKYGCELRQFFMTMGTTDMVAIIEAPNDEAMAQYGLALGASGALRTTTLKAFPEDAYRKIIAGI